MNSSDICHQVSGCPGLFVDAFRGHFLREHTKDPDATFVLSHYHGDHYTQLPRDHKYRGPAKIHCTPITARLLIDVHLVSEHYVVEHEYGSSFRHRIVQKQPKQGTTVEASDEYASITFYDANHCPGACIILIELPDGKTTHLHTGDMRYHPRFRSYPLLSDSAKQRKVDLVYLDTTYCHPKHDFLAQDDAVDSIASQTQELLSVNSRNDSPNKTLVLLSCYSIGKEKVLYEASKRSQQLIYVNEKKWKMLRCIQEERTECKHGTGEDQQQSHGEGASSLVHQQQQQQQQQQHINILQRCTRDPSASDLHVIPMGLAGEMWPYFQPNFQKLAKYVEELSSPEAHSYPKETANEGGAGGSFLPRTDYDKVVAFIPTGWADATNWNKKNAVSTKTVKLSSSSRPLHVEVRLISYSEHSTFPELVSFVQYLKPRKIIPTVYSDQSHKRQIEGRFRNMLDSTRAKKAFFRSMTKKTKHPLGPSTAISPDAQASVSSVAKVNTHSSINANDATVNEGKCAQNGQPNDSENRLVVKDESEVGLCNDAKENVEEDDEEISVLRVVRPKKSPSSGAPTASSSSRDRGTEHDSVDLMVTMGFDRQRAAVALDECSGNVQQAIHELLSEPVPTKAHGVATEQAERATAKDSHPQQSNGVKRRKISDFFAQRKK